MTTSRRTRSSGRGRAPRQAGITLIELLTVLVVISILASMALASYRSSVIRAQRIDATAALLNVAAAQEKFFLANNRYATDAELEDAPPAGLGIGGTAGGLYDLAITDDGDAATLDFIVTATPAADGGQAADEDCGSFSIDQTGRRIGLAPDASDNTAECWR